MYIHVYCFCFSNFALKYMLSWFVFVLFFFIEAERPSQQFFSHIGTKPTLPGFNQYCRESMCLAQGKKTVTPVGIEPRIS